MLRNQVETAILSIGLDPALGIMHRDGYSMPSLVFDLMESFRPTMDRLLLTNILNRELHDELFIKKEDTLMLTKEGRRKLIGLFTEKLQTAMFYRGIKTKLANHILTDAKTLSEIIKKS